MHRAFSILLYDQACGQGHGFGLSICYGIVTEHGGNIRVRNLATRGACFTIELPFQPAGSAAGQRVGAEAARHRIREPRILLIDRDESIAQNVEAILGGRGYQVKLAKNGRTRRSF